MSGEEFSDSNGGLRGLKTAPASLWHQSRGRGQHDAEADTFTRDASLRIMPERQFWVHEPAHEAAEERSKHNTIFISEFCK